MRTVTGTMRKFTGEACVIEREGGGRSAYLVEADVAIALHKLGGNVEGRKVEVMESATGMVTFVKLLAA